MCCYFAPLAVTPDGYSHLYQAWLLRGLLGGDPQVAEMFSTNSALLPNWLTALSLLALGTVFEPETSLKIAIAGAFLALLGGLWFACREASGGVRGCSFPALIPFALAGFLTMGFLGYVWSCGLVLFALGLVLAGLCAIGAEAGGRCRTAGRGVLFPSAARGSLVLLSPAAVWSARSLRVLAPWAPAGLLLGWFTAHFAEARSLTWILSPDLLFVERIVSTSRPDQLMDVAPTPTAVIPFAILLGALGAIAASARPLSPVLWAAALAAIAYVVTPEGTGDASLIDVRLLWWAIALLAIAALAGAPDRRMRMLCAILSSGIVLLFCAEYFLVAVRLAPAMRRLREAAEGLRQERRYWRWATDSTRPAASGGWPSAQRHSATGRCSRRWTAAWWCSTTTSPRPRTSPCGTGTRPRGCRSTSCDRRPRPRANAGPGR
ncbi:MAG: hypothetical protein R2748_22940 [Bryobacterales bacterium]